MKIKASSFNIILTLLLYNFFEYENQLCYIIVLTNT